MLFSASRSQMKISLIAEERLYKLFSNKKARASASLTKKIASYTGFRRKFPYKLNKESELKLIPDDFEKKTNTNTRQERAADCEDTENFKVILT